MLHEREQRKNWWRIDCDDEQIFIHGRMPAMSFDVPLVAVRRLLKEPSFRLIREETAIEVFEWNCGCSGCHLEGMATAAMFWCPEHS